MRVAVFTDNDFDKINGVTTTLTALVEHAPADVQPRIYTAATLPSDQPDYLALKSTGMPIPFYREMKMYVPRWREYLRRVQADGIAVLHMTTPGPLGLTAAWIAARTGLPLVGSFHTDLATYTTVLSGSPRLGYWMGEYMRWLYGRCRHVLVPSCATREALSASGLQRNKLGLWTRGVDTVLFDPERRSARLRHDWKVSATRPAVLYVGRVSREKGLDILPEMQRRLRGLGVDHRLVIAGDGPLRRWLVDRCPEAIFTGALGRESVAEVFASADLFVFPSRTDTAGNVVLEAQASGMPVIVGDAGGPREQMTPGVTGIICEGLDPDRWARAVAGLLRRADQRGAMGAAARRYALDRRWETALEPLYQTYRDLGAPSSSRPHGGIDHAAA